MEPGTLYIIASPIGNLEDITLRAIRILKQDIDYIYCEDTRQTRKLLSHYKIEAPVQSLHAHSSNLKIDKAINILLDGKSIAYLTDAGTPGISDPGSRFVEKVREKGLHITPIPGPSALTSIVSISGFPSKNIIFAGFLSKKDGKKRKELEKFKNFIGIIVIYESPYRIKNLIKVIHDVFPEAEVIIGREITKLFEEFISGKIEDINNNVEKIKEKGEFTLAIFNRK